MKCRILYTVKGPVLPTSAVWYVGALASLVDNRGTELTEPLQQSVLEFFKLNWLNGFYHATFQKILTPVIMTSEASSTTNNSRKRKLVDSEQDEVFVFQKKKDLTVNKTVSFSFPDLVEKIDENDESF